MGKREQKEKKAEKGEETLFKNDCILFTKARTSKTLIKKGSREECVEKCRSLQREGKPFRECLYGKEVLIKQSKRRRKRLIVRRKKSKMKYPCQNHNDCTKYGLKGGQVGCYYLNKKRGVCKPNIRICKSRADCPKEHKCGIKGGR